MEQVVALEGDYQSGELFTGDISQIMGIEEEMMGPLMTEPLLQEDHSLLTIATNAVKLDTSRKIAQEMEMRKI